MTMTRPHATIVVRIPLELKARIDADLRADPYGFENHGRYTGRRSINSETVKALEAAFSDKALKAEQAVVDAVIAKGARESASKRASKPAAGKRKTKRAVRGPQLALKLKKNKSKRARA